MKRQKLKGLLWMSDIVKRVRREYNELLTFATKYNYLFGKLMNLKNIICFCKVIRKVEMKLCDHDWYYTDHIPERELENYLKQGLTLINGEHDIEDPGFIGFNYYLAVCRKCGKQVIRKCGVYVV